MSGLDPRDRALLDAALAAEHVSASRRERTRAAVMRRVGAGAFASTVVASTTVGAAKAALGFSLGSSAKLLMAVLFAGSTAVGAAYVVQGTRSVDQVQVATAQSGLAGAVRGLAASTAKAPPAETAAALSAAPLQPPPPVAQGPREPREARAPDHALEDELQLISQAEAAFRRGDGVAAKALLGQHAQRFPRGQFAQEREGLRLIALCKSGSAGKAQAARFIRARPDSALSKRIRRACGLP